jgi:hypothetical protein
MVFATDKRHLDQSPSGQITQRSVGESQGGRSNLAHLPGNRSKPLILCQSTTFDDGSHGAERKDPATVVWYDNLLTGHGISPRLVAAENSRPF